MPHCKGSREPWAVPSRCEAAAIVLTAVCLAACDCVRFTAPEYQVRLSRAGDAGRRGAAAPVGRLYALSDQGSQVHIEYSLGANDFFRVDKTEGWIYPDQAGSPESGKIRIPARALDKSGLDSRAGVAAVSVTWSDSAVPCGSSDLSSLCFSSSLPIVLDVPESSMDRAHPVAYLKPGEEVAGCPTSYSVVGDASSSKHFFINATTSELYVVGADHEATHTLNATVLCQLPDGRSAYRHLRVNVLDVNDNGPRWGNQQAPHYREETVKIDPDKLKKPLANAPVLNGRGSPLKFTVGDQDTANSYMIYILHDQYSQFKLSNNRTIKASTGEYIGADLLWNKELILNTSTYIEVVFENANVVDSKGGLGSKTATARVYLEFVNHDELNALQLLPSYSVSVYRNSSRWTRVLRFDQLDHSALSFRIEFDKALNNSHCRSAIGITPSHGIVHLVSPADLHRCPLTTLMTTVSVEQGNRSKKAELQIDILPGELPDFAADETSCSFAASAAICESTIGLGAPLGYCTWQQGNSTSSRAPSKYSTCSPALATCPNQECDDLELLIPTLCPQDCTTHVIGNGHIHGERGVGVCMGVCSCSLVDGSTSDGECHFRKACPEDESAGMECRCSEGNANITDLDDEMLPHYGGPTIHSLSSTALICGKDCEAVIISAVAFIGIIGLSLAVWCRVHITKERARRAAASYRPWRVDSSMSLPSMVYASSGATSAATTPLTNVSMMSNWQNHLLTYYNIPVDLYDAKWELPRDSIILEKNLGEGEFGMVMKARVKLKESGVWCTAAVKMLKDGATSAEFADLLSEYKLLKEVNHSNVIKLIGAATRNGPFFVVVEYCEYGSLKSCLHDLRTSGQLQIGNASEMNSSSASELLSFCWQIAKGMQYLSEVKLVHRDLAARNILIATGKVIKISDFGLTRDVYEADAYEKKSHGRIPVKWMAPESLYHQIYTSKSDVWSFGVVLWEIATLGATPYPGIPPERMYRLLQAGYRMDKPETCSSRLYVLMRHCWEADPVNRPTFFDLRQQLEVMMEERVDYLHLSGAAAVRVCSLSSDDDSCGGGGTDSQPDSPSQALLPAPFSEKSGILEDYLIPGKTVSKYPPALFLKYLGLQHHDE